MLHFFSSGFWVRQGRSPLCGHGLESKCRVLGCKDTRRTPQLSCYHRRERWRQGICIIESGGSCDFCTTKGEGRFRNFRFGARFPPLAYGGCAEIWGFRGCGASAGSLSFSRLRILSRTGRGNAAVIRLSHSAHQAQITIRWTEPNMLHEALCGNWKRCSSKQMHSEGTMIQRVLYSSVRIVSCSQA